MKESQFESKAEQPLNADELITFTDSEIETWYKADFPNFITEDGISKLFHFFMK